MYAVIHDENYYNYSMCTLAAVKFLQLRVIISGIVGISGLVGQLTGTGILGILIYL